MSKPSVKQGGIHTTVEADRDGKIVVRRLRRIYTNAVDPNGDIPDGNSLEEAVREAIAQTEGQDIDGYDLRPATEGL